MLRTLRCVLPSLLGSALLAPWCNVCTSAAIGCPIACSSMAPRHLMAGTLDTRWATKGDPELAVKQEVLLNFCIAAG